MHVQPYRVKTAKPSQSPMRTCAKTSDDAIRALANQNLSLCSLGRRDLTETQAFSSFTPGRPTPCSKHMTVTLLLSSSRMWVLQALCDCSELEGCLVLFSFAFAFSATICSCRRFSDHAYQAG